MDWKEIGVESEIGRIVCYSVLHMLHMLHKIVCYSFLEKAAIGVLGSPGGSLAAVG